MGEYRIKLRDVNVMLHTTIILYALYLPISKANRNTRRYEKKKDKILFLAN